MPSEYRDDVLFWNLKRYGSPLVRTGTPGSQLSLEETLAQAVGLARRHPSVAQVWPVVYARNQALLDCTLLESLALELGHGRALGFLVSLTHELLGTTPSPTLRGNLVERLPEEPEYFFLNTTPDSGYARLAEERTPAVAREWAFRLNTPMESFRTCFNKFVG